MIPQILAMLSIYLLAAVCALAAMALRREHDDQQVREWWSNGFAALAAAAFLGGTWHGFAPYFTVTLLIVTWKLMVYCIGLFNLAMLTGSIIAVAEGRTRHILITVAALKFFVFAVWMLTNDGFEFVVADTAAALLGLALLHSWAALARADAGSRWVLGALGISLLAAAVQATHVTLAPLFNHNDLFYATEALAILLFYNGGRILRDRSPEAFA